MERRAAEYGAHGSQRQRGADVGARAHRAPDCPSPARSGPPTPLVLAAAFDNAPARDVVLGETLYRAYRAQRGTGPGQGRPPGGQARRWKSSAPMRGMIASAGSVVNWEQTLASRYAFCVWLMPSLPIGCKFADAL